VKRISADARIALIRGFARRGIGQQEIWVEYAEREGYGDWESYWNRIQDDYGKEAAREAGASFYKRIGERHGNPPGRNPTVGQIDAAMERDPYELFPPALPDELFALYIETAWDLLTAPKPAATYGLVGTVVEEPEDRWINGILEKNGAPCRFSDGKIEWIEGQPAGEQPVGDGLEDWPEIKEELRQVREAFRIAEGPAGYNAVGIRCERLVKAIGAQVFDPEHVPPGKDEPGPKDSQQQIANYFAAKATGKRNEAVKAMAEGLNVGVHKQVQAVKHREDADAEAAAFLISSICNLVDAIAAVREPDQRV